MIIFFVEKMDIKDSNIFYFIRIRYFWSRFKIELLVNWFLRLSSVPLTA